MLKFDLLILLKILTKYAIEGLKGFLYIDRFFILTNRPASQRKIKLQISIYLREITYNRNDFCINITKLMFIIVVFQTLIS